MPRGRGRPSRQIDPASPFAEFAEGLAGLRVAAGLSVSELAERISYSKPAISEAADGWHLPSEELTVAYARACGGSPGEWVAKRNAAASTSGRTPRSREAPAGVGEISEEPPSASAEPATPDSVHTPAELANGLRHLKGARSYRDLARSRGADPGDDDRRFVLAPSTLSDLLLGKTMPSRRTMVAFLRACDVSGHEERAWLAAWERVSTAHLHKPAGAVRVRDARARLLGVHASIEADADGDDLPAYVARDIDEAVRANLNAVSARGGLVVLVGNSATGKTRSLFEAVRAVLPEWWLVHPAEMAALDPLLDAPAPRTVVWLDDLQRYPDQHAVAVRVRRAIAAGFVVAGTLATGDHRAPSSRERRPGPYTTDSAMLSLGHVVDVPDAFTPAERQRAKELSDDDPRLWVAVDTSDTGVTQVLAAGPALIRRWELADDPYSKAVITAALDARLLGAQAPLSLGFLAAAAPGYLSSRERAVAPEDWLRRSVEYATEPVHGVASCLIPLAVGMGDVLGYQAADYLCRHVHATRGDHTYPPELWQALVDHHPGDTARLKASAERHEERRFAIGFYQRSAAADPDAAERLAELLAEQGRARLADLLGEGL
ncbi:hypothetical protein Ade02nite_03060 [Paractinoplanes deccanensis]|uniref:HTH cro/C1-type domain-containing protein n=1 Tax=Paractinoplanes deccanensis TaxID=113561 RepID=A0ABQ3XV90_9ACTN|nr:helix-turn-helix transcriptional regulator [Actinoplanes deccanensis]GID71665.1 hypothetical protein Ade02nite_03060 [Actinoplanes deccanensis]